MFESSDSTLWRAAVTAAIAERSWSSVSSSICSARSSSSSHSCRTSSHRWSRSTRHCVTTVASQAAVIRSMMRPLRVSESISPS